MLIFHLPQGLHGVLLPIYGYSSEGEGGHVNRGALKEHTVSQQNMILP